ncbi:MAG: response regulator [Oscillospiraceae bacterium]|nr:response regulator [Oscillospiraceae bacterium]
MSSEALRVLLLEPSPGQRELARALLESGGIEVCTAATGPEALDLADSFRPHTILTELILPGFSGLEFIHRYRSRQGAAKVWVVTAASGTWAAEAALSAGADFLFYKPVYWPELIRQLRRQTDAEAPGFLEDALLRLGLPRSWAGFSQTARCARLLYADPGALLKALYIQIAREEGSSPDAVSRNIQRCIKLLRASPLLPPGLPPDLSGKDFLLSLARGAIIPL